MAPEAIEDEARRRGDEAVGRIREASGRRVDRQRRWRAFSSWCALASLAGGISLAALSAHEARLQEQSLLSVAARDAPTAVAKEKPARATTEEERGGPCLADPDPHDVDDQLAMFEPAKGRRSAKNKRGNHRKTGGRCRSVVDDAALSE